MQGTAQHYNWQTGIINKNTSCLLLSGKNFQLKRGPEYNTLRVGDPFLLPRLGTTLTSVLHPKLILRGSNARNNSLYNHFSQSFADFGLRIWRFIVSAGGKAVLGLHHQSGNLTRLLLVPHIHALSLLFPNSTTEGACGDSDNVENYLCWGG